MKTPMRWAILICMSLLLVSHSVVAQDSKPQKVTLMLDWFPNADHVPLYAAQQKGIFKQHGLDVELLAPADPNDPLKLVAAGKYPFAVNYQPSVTIARSQGLPVKAIGVLVEHPLNTISFLKESGIKTPSDLKGKTIGYAVGPLDVVLFETIARNAGLQKADYELINIGFNITPSLLSGKIDAVIGAYWNYEINELALEGKDAGYFPLEKHGVPDFYELVLISNDTFLKQHPKAAKRLMAAMRQAIQFTKDHPDDALAAYFKANPDVRKALDEKAFRATLPVFATTQTQSESKWETFAEFALKAGLIEKPVVASELFRNVLAE
ncbi:MAG: ABC transporter substrate-binding protein [Candidatus Tectomicrobia bacterium]|nr:ABC transporter substrate-binding protein [Candidatus Tectomicrobia bacterium]